MKIRRLLALVGLVSILLAGVSGTPIPAARAQDEPQTRVVSAVEQVIAARQDIPAFQFYDQRVSEVFLSDESTQAVIWLASYDRNSGEALATEPGVVLAQRDPEGETPDDWQVLLPYEDGWLELVAILPESLRVYIPEELIDPAAAPEETYATYGGYYLPWAGGLTKYLSWAANHLSCPEKCLHAVDFYDDTMFPLLAAKGGTVFGYKDTCFNGATDCTNYIALEDRSTSPYTYQIYLHLANGTIPAALKNLGASVLQGQFIGNVDDTGYSEGHHVHFMVVTYPYFSPYGYWWGYSADITYKDVFINWDDATQGGRPCTAVDVSLNGYFPWCQESQFAYVSGNQGANPPIGSLTAPTDKFNLRGNTLTVSGWGQDDLGVSELQVIARYDGVWRNIGAPQTNTPFTTNIDICEAGIPDGPVDIGLRVWDEEGNQVMPLNVRHLLVDSTCPPASPPSPGCTPGDDQVALYSQPNFGGSCIRLGVDVYPTSASFGSIGDNAVESIKVGDNVKLILFDGANFEKRQETFGLDDGKDRNLADNRLGSQSVSSAIVTLRSETPANPELHTPQGPQGTAPTSVDSLVLAWGGGDGATKFQAELYQDDISGAPLRMRSWSIDTSWSVGTLVAGTYAWRVQGRISELNGTQHLTDWVSGTFTVSQASLPNLSQVTAPFNDNLNVSGGSWTPTGLWSRRADPDNSSNVVFAFNNGTDYADPVVGSGDLTSRPILIPAAGYYLRFDSYNDTESSGSDWDQRRVQISVIGAPFTDLYQFSDDRTKAWLHSPQINLNAYAGQVVRIRFHFDIVDRYNNAGYLGWLVDNIALTNSPALPSCADAGNDIPGGAVLISYGQVLEGTMCPAGDTDYYKITAARGDRIIVDIDAASFTPSSPLDAVLNIAFQGDTASILAENDDESPGIVDPYLAFYVEEAGTYYLRVRSWDHPGEGSTAHAYTIHTTNAGGGGVDPTEPTVTFTSPASTWLPDSPVTLSANAVDDDAGTGVSRVEFYWHTNDWSAGKWELVGTDWDVDGGWSVLWDTSGLTDNTPYAVFARAVDWAGNARLHAKWAVRVDSVAPQVALDPLSGTQTETPVRLTWSGNDALSGLSRYMLEVNRDNLGWNMLSSAISSSTLNWWYVGVLGHSYQFRLRAYDRAGNLSSPSLAQVTLAPTCQGDVYEEDNSPAAASVLPLLVYQEHSICGVGDADWIQFTPQAGKTYLLWAAASLYSVAMPAVQLFAPDSITLLASDSTSYFGGTAAIIWTAPSSSTYYLKVTSSDPRVAGTYIQYQVWVGPGYPTYMPVVTK